MWTIGCAGSQRVTLASCYAAQIIAALARLSTLIVMRDTLEILDGLLEDVVTFVERGELLLASKPFVEIRQTVSGRVGCEIRSIAEYIEGSRVDTQESDYLTLENDFLSKIEATYQFVRSYSAPEFTSVMRDKIGRVSKAVTASGGIRRFAAMAAHADDQRVDEKTHVQHVSTCLSRQCAAIMYGRALTLSTRFAPLEVLFDALRTGLFPYGWSWESESVLCVQPTNEA